ncbi:MAG: tetratricopeptide repeat protein [Rubrivivax sp.]|nr:tetratricopeptide repeat protein [Pyrinomonadaceae bacterium]
MFEADDFGGAVEAFRAAVRINSLDAGANYNLGVSLYRTGKLADAVVALRRALSINAAHSAAQLNLCLSLADLGRASETLTACKRSLQLRADDPYAYLAYGSAFSRLGMHEEAATAFTRSIKIKPDLWEAQYRLGVAYYEWGKFDEALVALDSAARLTPHPDFVQKTTADYASRLSAAQVESQRKGDSGRLTHLGNAFRRLGQYRDAVSAYRKALAFAPRSAVIYNNLGLAYYGLGDFYAAEEAYLRATRLDPKFVEAHYGLGWTYHILRKKRDSSRSCSVVSSLDPALGSRLTLAIKRDKDFEAHPGRIPDIRSVAGSVSLQRLAPPKAQR